jgi:hypothetical protein
MRRRYKLKDMNVYVGDHYNPQIERARKRLYPILKKARGKQEYRGKISLVDDHIILNGEEIGVNDFDKLPSDIHPRHICTETRGDVTFFFKSDSPLSNHHHCEISLDDDNYNCVEQGYFHRKAIICKDIKARDSIMATRNPASQKYLGDRIEENEQWQTDKLVVMKQMCQAKFDQNDHLKDFLLETRPTYLAEDNPRDSYFGIGLHRNSPRAADRNNFKTNHLGVILMKIRDSL